MKNTEFQKFANSLGVPTTTIDSVKNSMTPMILEERQLRVTQMSVFDRLMMDRIIWISGGIESRMASVVQAQLMFLDTVDNKEIKLHIDSPGGSVTSGLGIIDIMKYIKSDISTVNMGMCASMGSVILSAGTKGKRMGTLFSKIMLHHVSSGTSGTIDDQRISLMESEKYNYLLFKILSENTGKKFNEIHDISNRDKWFDSSEALKYNLIDNVIGGDKISTYMDGFDEYFKQKNVI